MESPPKFVWLLFRGNVYDMDTDTDADLQNIYSSKSKAEKGAKEIMDGYSSPLTRLWWMTKLKEEDEIIWNGFHDVTRMTDSETYVRIVRYEVK